MSKTIDYKVNIDTSQAMSDLQMVDMQMDSSMGAMGPAPSMTHTRQLFGDMAFSGQQMASRIGSPAGQGAQYYGGAHSMNFGTAAFTTFHPTMAGSPMGVSRSSWQSAARGQFATQVGRGAAGAGLGFASEFGGLAVGGVSGAFAGAAFGTIPGLAVGVGGFMAVSAIGERASTIMGERNMLQDVIRSTSGMSSSGSRSAERAIYGMQLNNPLMNTEDMMNIAGHVKGGGSPQEYLKKFRKLTAEVQEVSTVLNTSLAEGMAVIGQLKGAGVGSGAITTLAGMGGGDPSKIRGLINTGMWGSGMFNGTGMARGGGFWQAIQTQGMVGGLGLSGEYMHQAGGKTAVAQMLMGSNINFLQSGAGVAMQAGMWQGGTAMGGGGGMDPMGLMSMGAGNLASSGDFFSFSRNRALGVGKLSPGQRMQMEGKFNVQMATMAADQMGADVGDILFYQAQQMGMSAPQAEAWARAQQRAAKGGGGGGPSKGQLIDAQIERQHAMHEQTAGPGVLPGRIRDTVDAYINRRVVEPFMDVGDAISGGISARLSRGQGVLGMAGADAPLSAPRDLVKMSVTGDLQGTLSGMSGLSIANRGWSGHFGRTIDSLRVKRSPTGGEGMIELSPGSYASVNEIYEAQAQADSAVSKGWDTDYQKIKDNRGNDYGQQLARLRRHRIVAGGHEDIANIFRTQGFGGVAGAIGADITTPTGVAAMRTFTESMGHDFVKPEAVAGLSVHQALATAAGTKREEALGRVYDRLHGRSSTQDLAVVQQHARLGAATGFGAAGAIGGGLAALAWGLAPFTGGMSLVGAAGIATVAGIGTAAVGYHGAVGDAASDLVGEGYEENAKDLRAGWIAEHGDEHASWLAAMQLGVNEQGEVVGSGGVESYNAIVGLSRSRSAGRTAAIEYGETMLAQSPMSPLHEDYNALQGMTDQERADAQLRMMIGRTPGPSSAWTREVEKNIGSGRDFWGGTQPHLQPYEQDGTTFRLPGGGNISVQQATDYSAGGALLIYKRPDDMIADVERRLVGSGLGPLEARRQAEQALVDTGTIRYSDATKAYHWDPGAPEYLSATGIANATENASAFYGGRGGSHMAVNPEGKRRIGGGMYLPGDVELSVRGQEASWALGTMEADAQQSLLHRTSADKVASYIDDQAAGLVDLDLVEDLTPKKVRNRYRKKGQTVPVAAGVDATERELYNSVLLLSQSVRRLSGSIHKKTKPEED